MTLSEIKTALREYAKEDIAIVKEEGAMSIINTAKGVIDLKYICEMFDVWSNGGVIFRTDDEEVLENWLMNQYTVELK